jgi:hypothetical protein
MARKAAILSSSPRLTEAQSLELTTRIGVYRDGAQKIFNKYWADSNFTHSPGEEMVVEDGPRYVRIWGWDLVWIDRNDHSKGWTRLYHDGQRPARRIHTFIDKLTGDILKPATWKAPAKHPRGNLFDESNGLAHVTPHGPAYLR